MRLPCSWSCPTVPPLPDPSVPNWLFVALAPVMKPVEARPCHPKENLKSAEPESAKNIGLLKSKLMPK